MENIHPKIDLSNFLDIYVLHYSPLESRRRYIEKIGGIMARTKWITEKDITADQWELFSHKTVVFGMNETEIGSYFRTNVFHLRYPRYISHFFARLMLITSRFLPRIRAALLGSKPPFKRLDPNLLEFALMHICALEKFIESEKDWYLVFEDDAIFDLDFESNLKKLIGGFDPNSERIFISLGSGAGLKKRSLDFDGRFEGLFRVSPASARCLAASVFSRTAAVAIYSLIQKDKGIPDWLSIDFSMSLLLKVSSTRTYWAEPPIILQGSETGAYKSNFR